MGGVDSKTRRSTIAERLRTQGEASIVELAALFGTSEMTIRRDLDQLEDDGLARRARGGAISVQSRSFEPPILQRASHSSDAKHAIGAAAASMLRENETVFLDVGTTTHEMAKAIAPDVPITAITSSLLIAMELSTKPAVKTIVTGGVIRLGEMSLIGPRAQASFADLNFDGQSDLVLYRDRGVSGTTLLVLRGTYRKLKPYAVFTDPTLVWATATPY